MHFVRVRLAAMTLLDHDITSEAEQGGVLASAANAHVLSRSSAVWSTR